MLTSTYNQLLSLFQDQKFLSKPNDQNNVNKKHQSITLKIQSFFHQCLYQNKEIGKITKKINCDSINIQKIEDLWKKLVEVLEEEENLHSIDLIKTDKFLVIPKNLIEALSHSPNCSVDDLFKCQEIILGDEKLSLNGFERELLIQQSHYFSAIWNGNFKESSLDQSISINIPKDHLETFLDFFKTSLSENDHWKRLFLEELTSLLETASFLNIPKVFDAVEKELIKRIESFNYSEKHFPIAVDLWEIAYENNCPQLLNAVEQYFSYCLRKSLESNKEIDFIKIINRLSHLAISFIDLSSCSHFSDKNLELLTSFKDLKSLNLIWCNQLTNKSFEILKKFERLQSLDLSWTSKLIKGLENLKDLKDLQVLNLKGWYLIDEDFEVFKYFKNLKSLNLGYCEELTDEDLEFVTDLKKLQILSFNKCNRLTGKSFEILAKIENLKSLNLSWCNQLTNNDLKKLKNCKNLKELDLSFCDELTDAGLEELQYLENLEFINLGYCNQLTNQGLKNLKKLKKLQSINLSYCNRLTDECFEILKEFENLQFINLSYCEHLTDKGLQDFEKLRPIHVMWCRAITLIDIDQYYS